MPELKSLYFAPDGTWFSTRKECDEYELKKEICDFIWDNLNCSSTRQEIEWFVSIILTRYNLEQCYDWKAPTNEEPEI